MASSYESSDIGIACLTSFGLAVNMPLTSVQISNLLASKIFAIILAVKSDPPLPSVIILLSWLEAIKPGITWKSNSFLFKLLTRFFLVLSKSMIMLLPLDFFV